MDNRQSHHDIPPAGMGGTSQQWLRYEAKQERQQRQEEQREQAQRAARYRARAAKAAKTRRKRKNARQVSSALHGVLVAGVALTPLVASTVVKHMWRTW